MNRVVVAVVVWCSLFIIGMAVGPAGPRPARAEGAAAVTASASHRNALWDLSTGDLEACFSLGVGWRRDDLNWSVAGNSAGTNPNILSELKWSGVDSRMLRVDGRVRAGRFLYVRGSADYAWIDSGHVRDSDYDGDNRTAEFSRSESHTRGDNVKDLSLGAGVPFLMLDARLIVAPLVGFSWHRQNFRITDGEQTITWVGGPDLGPIDNLDSTYQAQWRGPWLGVDLFYRLPSSLPAMAFGLSMEMHWAEYCGQADWNLRDDLAHPVSFEQQADGHGFVVEGRWLYELTRHLDVNLMLQYGNWTTGHGTDRVFFNNGLSSATRLNEVNWETRSLLLGATYHFF